MAEIHIFTTPEDTAEGAAAFVAPLAENCAQAQGRFTVALSGGSTPRRLYQLLASAPHAGRLAWDRWHIFWSDERCVPPDHQESNYRMAKETLLDHVPIPSSQVHRIRGEATPQLAAQEYEDLLRQIFQTTTPVFDLILLGIGEDGHTASLFPGTTALREEKRLVVANWVPHLQAYRITFTLLLITIASTISFLVTDGSKAAVIRQVLEPAPGDPMLPAAQVRPTSGALHWFLTKSAASQLKGAPA